MEQVQHFEYPSCDGVHTVHACRWLPEGEARGVIQIVHGVAEHIGRYEETAQFFTRHGFIVVGEDHLGHGLTTDEANRGFFAEKNGWKLVVRDIRKLRRLQGDQTPELPYFLLGHSMGSFLARTYLIDYPRTLTGAIISGTGQEPAPLVLAGKLAAQLEAKRLGSHGLSTLVDTLSLGAYNRKFKPNRTSADWISRDEARVDAYLADPLCAYKPTVTMFRDMMGGLQYIAKQSNLDRMYPNTPIYFFSGDEDPVGGMGKGVQKVTAMFRASGCQHVTLRLYQGGRHEMLNEINRQEVLDDLLAWLEALV